MDNKNKQVDRRKLSIEQVAQLEQYEASQKQLAELGEITKKLQSVITVLNATQQKGEKDTNNLGSLLMDIRESIDELTSKEDPETPDYAKPVVEAVSKLEKALTASIKAVDVKPQVNVAAPQVETKTDLSGVEKILKGDIPKAFEKAVKSLPKVEVPKTDFTPLLDKLEELSKQLADIDTGVRLKPVPGSMKVTNVDGGSIGKATDGYGIQAISDDGTYKYYFFEDSAGNWYILRKTLATSVFLYTKGTGGYASVYQSAILGPSGSPTFASYGTTF